MKFFLLSLLPLLPNTAAATDQAAIAHDIVRSLADDNPNDHYCGTTWPDAYANCHKPCSTQNDDECADLGSEYGCFGYTGCKKKLGLDEVDAVEEEVVETETVTVEEGEGECDTLMGKQMYCGKTWLDAATDCSQSCCGSSPCPSGQTCQLATNCHVDIITLRSNMLITMQGPDRPMENTENEVFGGTMNDIIGAAAGAKGIKLGGVDVGEQTLVDRRTLYDRWGERYLSARIYNVTQRFLPSGSSALDVSMVVTGDYRPPPYLDLDVITEDSINRDAGGVVQNLKERGSRAGSQFFNRVSGVEAVARAAVTQRPTRAPTVKPTPGPTGPPTAKPSMEPSVAPSDMPSMEPSRTVYNSIMTGSQKDLLVGGSTTSSYGYIWNIRSKPDAGVTLITGIDFYTTSTDEVDFALYSRIGNFQDHKASIEGWDVIAEGKVRGRGVGRYTSIPQEMFTPLDIPGGGGGRGIRAFYLRLSTINLVYKTSEGTASDNAIQMETPDLEIWEGEAVLSKELPDPNDPMSRIFFRYPRAFLGTIYYDRVPCKPFSAYGLIKELPCPDLPTQAPSLPQPSMSPVTSAPTRRPVSQAPVTPSPFWGTPAPLTPTETPTFAPTVSRAPSLTPSTSYPTGSPVIPMKVHLNVNLRGAPERPMSEREYEKFLEIMTNFLNKFIEDSMAIQGIDIWYQQQILVDAPDNSTEIVEIGADVGEIPTLPGKKSRELQLEQDKKDQIIAFKKKQKEETVPQTTAMQITLIIKVSFSYLPEDLLAKLAVVTIQENKSELMMMLQEQSNFYTYFKPLNGITSDVVLELTPPPSPAPSTLAFYLANNAEVVVLEEDSGFGFGALVGLAIGFLWCCLTGCSVAYVMKARTAMREQKDLEDLLKQEKNSEPVGEDNNDSETASDRSSSDKDLDIPMGNEDEVSLSTEAELSVLERKKASMGAPKLRIVEEAIDVTEESVCGPDDAQSVAMSAAQLRMSRTMKRVDSGRQSSRSSANLSDSMKKSIENAGLSDSLRNSSKQGQDDTKNTSGRGLSSSRQLSDSMIKKQAKDAMKGSVRVPALTKSLRNSSTRKQGDLSDSMIKKQAIAAMKGSMRRAASSESMRHSSKKGDLSDSIERKMKGPTSSDSLKKSVRGASAEPRRLRKISSHNEHDHRNASAEPRRLRKISSHNEHDHRKSSSVKREII